MANSVHRDRSSLGAIAEAEESSVDTDVTANLIEGATDDPPEQHKTTETSQDFNEAISQRGLTRDDVTLLSEINLLVFLNV